MKRKHEITFDGEQPDTPFCFRCSRQWVEGAEVKELSPTHIRYRCRCGAYYSVRDGVLSQPAGDRPAWVRLREATS